MQDSKPISCPICHKATTFDSLNIYRPFCSHRCKLIDLGEWANESRRIPAEEASLSEKIDDNE